MSSIMVIVQLSGNRERTAIFTGPHLSCGCISKTWAAGPPQAGKVLEKSARNPYTSAAQNLTRFYSPGILSAMHL